MVEFRIQKYAKTKSFLGEKEHTFFHDAIYETITITIPTNTYMAHYIWHIYAPPLVSKRMFSTYSSRSDELCN
jgi:hypothetical protein